MISLNNFQYSPSANERSIYEKDGRIVTLPLEEVSLFSSNPLLNYPEINISRELFQSSTHLLDDNRSLMLPVQESLAKRITRKFFEEGFVEALNEANTSTVQNPVLSPVLKYVLFMVDLYTKAKLFISPHLREQGVASIEKYSQTRMLFRSTIRCIKWHPNCFKIAVAASDDTIRVYTDEPSIVPILKSGLQKCVSCLAWRPYSAGELAIGCKNGILLRTVDPNSLISRPLSQAIHLKHENHFPVTAIDWNPNGSLLASASINDSDILIWDVDLQKNSPLRRVGASCSFIAWSPSSSRLCSTTVSNVFRVWHTETWTPERWTIEKSSVQSAVWSPCGSYLLFVTTDEPFIYSLSFLEEHIFQASTPKQALPVADLTKITVNNNEIGGKPQSLAWCPLGKILVVNFKDTLALAVFYTTVTKQKITITPSCFLNGYDYEFPACISFQENTKYNKNENNVTVLTIGWSTGRVQYFSFQNNDNYNNCSLIK